MQSEDNDTTSRTSPISHPGEQRISTPRYSLLGYMQRRLSDFMAPETRPTPDHDSALEPQDDDLSNAVNTRNDEFYRGRASSYSIAANWRQNGDEEYGPPSRSLLSPLNESPLHRAGLLQPRSYNALSPSTNFTALEHFHTGGQMSKPAPHSQDTIRLATMKLSNMSFAAPSDEQRADEGVDSHGELEQGDGEERRDGPGFIFPHADPSPSIKGILLDRNAAETPTPTTVTPHTAQPSTYESPSLPSRSPSPSALEQSISSLPTTSSTTSTFIPSSEASPRSSAISEVGIDIGEDAMRPSRFQPSGLSLLRPSSASSPSSSSSSSSKSSSSSSDEPTPHPQQPPLPPPSDPGTTPRPVFALLPTPPEIRIQSQPPTKLNKVHWRDPSPFRERERERGRDRERDDERTPLLTATTAQTLTPPVGYTFEVPPPSHGKADKGWFGRVGGKIKEVEREVVSGQVVKSAVRALPAVLLGCLLNILDGVSYGMIIFPASGVFVGLGPMGVSMFFVSTVVSQLVYTLGGSGFAGANGSMMIEVVPFFHILANSIAAEIGEDYPREIIATTFVAYALSSIMTGLCFFLLGVLKLGVIVGFFPRHILVGCIGGVGVFLLITGFAVSMRIPDDDFTASLETLKMMFLDGRMLLLWTIPLLLAVLLRIVTTRWHHQLIFPLYFIIIPLIFYVVITAAQIDLYDLRKAGWLFDMGDTAHEPWWQFYTYLDFHAVRFGPLWSTLPTQFALLFFNILHPPLNVPALAVSLNDDVDTNKELVAHGYSNLLAGLVGTVPNYLVYVNTLLFYRVGGGTRIAGFLLAVATALLLIIGTGPIAYIPVMVVGALIFVLGLDLVKEALWDTRHRVSRTEYITIVSIMVCMTVWDFVIGVLFGIVVSCFFFVVQNSRRRSIRAIFTGDSAMSAVRRPYSHREYLREVTKQTTVLRLQGFLFFGTIAHVEETIRSLIDGPAYQLNPVRFLVLDLSLVAGVDMSAAEAFVRIQRLLSAKLVTLVLCGFVADTDSSVGQALESVGVLGADGVELFNTFNNAMEWTENVYIDAWFRSQKVEVSSNALTVPERQDADIEYSRPFGSFVRSPRRSHMREVGNRTIAVENPANQVSEHHSEPLKTLMQTFSSYGEVDATKFRSIQRYFECIAIPAGYLLWKQGDPSDGLYVIEKGALRASYVFANPSSGFEESMAPFTVAGELSALSDSPRNATVVAEHASVLWKMNSENLQNLQVEEPELSRTFFQLVLKTAKTDYDILLLSLASRQ